MKKLFFIIGLFFSLSAMAQPTNYTKINMRYRWLSGMFDSALYVPRYNGTPSGVRVNETSAIDGMIAMDTTNNRLYIYSGGSWIRLAAYTEITGGNLYVDSLWRTPGVDSIFWLKNGITYKLKDSTGGGGVNIYNSDGTLTGNRLVSANNNSFQIDSFSTIGFFGKSANPSSVLTRKNIYTFNSDDSGLDGIYLQTFQNGGIGKTRIELKNEDINIDATETISINTQDSADVIIGKLPSGSSTDSVLVWTAGTGQVKKRNVSSLVSTPTLQEVLTAGSTLTTTNEIYGNANSLLFDNFSSISFTANNVNLNGISSVLSVSDSILLQPNQSILNIDSLRSATIADTLYKKPMTWDTRNGRWEYLTQWPSRIDTITIASFGYGARLAGDTAAATDSSIYGAFYHDGSDTLIITGLRAVITNGDTLGVQVYYNDTINVIGSAVATSTLAVNSSTTGNSTTTFSNNKIPPGNWVWCKSPTVVAGRKPEYLSVSLIGYRKTRQ